AHELTTHRIGALVVTTDGRSIAGILSERDIVRHLAERGGDGLADAVAAAMTSTVRTCGPADTVEDLMEVMTEHRIRHLPVIIDGDLAGIISIGDVVKHRVEALEEERRHLTDYIQTGR
ncbi:MAG TPA: CBS domain-containing protein, partial [Acidimicrobiales bacterium]